MAQDEVVGDVVGVEVVIGEDDGVHAEERFGGTGLVGVGGRGDDVGD